MLTSTARVLDLEQQLLEKNNELAALRESHTKAENSSGDSLDKDEDCSVAPCDTSASFPDYSEETQEEETTLVAEDTSVLSISVDAESTPELTGHQSESPEESKGTSSDEMVTSSDSEVVHSSWTLLEAVNQDGSQEWPSIMQDFSQLQSWETTSMEQVTPTVQAESPSVIVRETVQVHLRQNLSSTDANVSPGQVFAQALVEELQNRYSELLAELQRLRAAAGQSQEKIKSLEEEAQSLTSAKAEAESQASDLAEELRSVREELDKVSQQSSSVVEQHRVDMQLLEEQVNILSNGSTAKEQKIQALQTDLQMAQQSLSEREGQARMLSAQLEDRELLSSELEMRLQHMENTMLEYSQTSDLNNQSLSKKDLEISDLQLRLHDKEQEMVELSGCMSAKLLQAEEDKFQVDGEVSKLKEQILELEKVREENSQASCEDAAAPAGDELAVLLRDKEVLEAQLANTKKKLQAALVQRKELMKKVADFELEAKNWKEQEDTAKGEATEAERYTIQEMEGELQQLKQALKSKEDTVESLEHKVNQQDQVIAEMLINKGDNTDTTVALRSQVASLEAECDALQKKLQEAQESRKETIRKAKEKDRHHRDQLKQQKEEYNELMERFEAQGGERDALLAKLRELEENVGARREELPHPETKDLAEHVEKQAAGDWVQEDWVDFAASESDSSQPQPSDQSDCLPTEADNCVKTLGEDIQTLRKANAELVMQLQETQTGLSQKEAELWDLAKELQALRDKERQIDALSEEVDGLREKYRQAESYAETLKAEMEADAKVASADSLSSVATLQAEVDDFKQFLDQKNHEIMELSQQLSEQKSFIHSMQDTVSEKDQLIASLQEELKVAQEKQHKLEAEVPQKQEDDNDSGAKIQQLQRKLQAALISRKEALKDNKSQKEQLTSAEALVAELQQKIESADDELEKLRTERVRLIDEVDRTLLENQSLGSSCESLKLAMDGMLNEKDACKREVELAKDEAARMSREWEEKVQGMKDEYETLLKSYENVSDEAERVRRVLEAARQERQELTAKVRTHEAARQEAERQAEEAQKEVDLVKDRMRKFAKTKQQKILELEEENERLRELQEKPAMQREDDVLKAEAQRRQEALDALRAELDSTAAERDSLGLQVEELREQIAQVREEAKNKMPLVSETSTSVTTDTQTDDKEKPTNSEETQSDLVTMVFAPETYLQHADVGKTEEIAESVQTLLEEKLRMEDDVNAERGRWQEREAELTAELTSLKRDVQENKEKENKLVEEGSKREAQFKELLRTLEAEKDNLEERLMNQLAQLNGSMARYQQEAADNRQEVTELQRQVEMLETERAELEAQAQGERARATRLEEELRQAQRERAEAEWESGKQRELEQQLKTAQRVKEGSQSRVHQLEELLREKQLEVRHQQKDGIRYQERISELGREAKVLQLGYDELSTKLQQSQLETAKTLDELKNTDAEWTSCKRQLVDAQQRLGDALAEKKTLEQSVQQKEAAIKAEAEQTLDSVRFRLGAELKEMELRLEEAYREREKEEEATLEARETAEGAERRAQETQARLDESLARLAAFSRCMSSLQDDRDRVLDETRQWETRFNDALQAKEAEIREAETRIKELTEQFQKETALKEELQLSLDR